MAEDIRQATAALGQPPVTTPARGHTMPTDWGELGAGYGPYKRFPNNRQMIAEFCLMRKFEPTVKRTLAVLTSLIVGKLGQYTHPDETIQERVNDWLGRVEGGASGIVKKLLSAMWAGFCVCEPIWRIDGREWTYERIELLHPLSFFKRDFSFGGASDGIQVDKVTKRVEWIRQFPAKAADGEIVVFPRRNVIYWPFGQELREQVYGNSILAGARRAWFSKTKEENFWNTFAQKCAMPTPVIRTPAMTIEHPETREQVSLSSYIMQVWEKLEPGQALAIPMDPDSEFSVDILAPVGTGEAFERVTDYWKSEIFSSMLAPRLVLEEPEHGTRAQASTVLDLFYNLIDGIRAEAGGVMIGDVVSPLLRYNVGEVDDPGKWAWEPLQDEDLQLLANVYETVQRGRATAMNAGLGQQEADERKTRETFARVLADPGEVQLVRPPEAPSGGVDRYQ